MKIGKFVQQHIKQIFFNCDSLEPNEIYSLFDPTYSRDTFRICFPFCIELENIESEHSKRYWKEVYFVRGKRVRVTSQWYEGSRSPFIEYLESKGIAPEPDSFGYESNEDQAIMKQQDGLQSAQVHGRERRTIIGKELLECTDEQGAISRVLEEIETKILKAHLPIEHTFKFICQTCRTQYDSDNGRPQYERGLTMKTSFIGDDFPKLSRIKLWANHPHQVNHRIVRAFLSLERSGDVEFSNLRQYCTESLQISNFDGHYASMKTNAGNSHGKVFFNEGSKVKIWGRVRKEIDTFFH